MTRILFIGQKPETVDFSDPSHKAAPEAAIAFNTRPEDAADAAHGTRDTLRPCGGKFRMARRAEYLKMRMIKLDPW
jgi:hypothetical protein